MQVLLSLLPKILLSTFLHSTFPVPEVNMISLVLSILCSVAIANLLTWFNRSSRNDIYYIFAGNYLVASLFSWSTNHIPLHQAGIQEYGLGIVAGLFFLINFLIYQKNIIRNGQSISVGMMRISLIIPTPLANPTAISSPALRSIRFSFL